MLDSGGFIAGNDGYLTLSFATDGTSIADQPNTLATTFNAIAPTADWQDAILRAFQTWAVETNGDIGVVSDGGQPFGSPGPSQDDGRFGDIRIGAIKMTSEVGAVSMPADALVSGTWSGDVVFNAAFNYQTLDDIFAVALHEAGHVFGLEDSTDPTSPMFTGGAPSGLSPTTADLATLQQQHGVRAADSNEPADNPSSNNNSIGNATRLELVEAGSANEGTAPSILYGDIANNLDRDFFELKTPGDYIGPATIVVRSSGISLLAPTVNIYNEAEDLIAQSISGSTSGDLLSLVLPSVAPDETYYIEVVGSSPGLFGIGGFSLVTTFDGINQIPQSTIDSITGGQFRFLEQEDFQEFFDADGNDFLNDDAHSDDTSSSAAGLKTTTGFVEATRYEVVASIADAADVDFYSFKSPAALPVPLNVMTVLVRSIDAGGLIPTASVLDSNGLPVAFTILANGAGEYIIQVEGVNAGDDYQVEVGAADKSGLFKTGNYSLNISFGSQATQLTPLASGVVGNGTTQNDHTLYIGQPQLFHFAFKVNAAATTSPTVVAATIKNDAGEVVYQIATAPGETRSREAVFLPAGNYTVEVIPWTLDGSIAPQLSYSLLGAAISDPFVGDPNDPTNNPFACTEAGLEGLFCYPGGFVTPDPFLWDSFIASTTNPPDLPNLPVLISFLFGDWWSWVWNQSGINGPPFGIPDTIQVQASSSANAPLLLSQSTSVLANDIDPESGPLVAILKTGPANGTLSIETDGIFVYSPNVGFTGRDEFTYTAFDFSQESASTTVSIIVGESGDFSANGETSGIDFLSWQLSFGTTAGATLASGDSDFDGDVDSQDLSNWQKQFGQTVGGIPSNGDADSDGDFDGLDFLAWQRGFGTSTNATSAGGDADADRDTDAQDLTKWEANFGTAPVVGVSAVAVAASTASGSLAAPTPIATALVASQKVLLPKIALSTTATAATTSIVPAAVQTVPVRRSLLDNDKIPENAFLKSPYAAAFATSFFSVQRRPIVGNAGPLALPAIRHDKSHDDVKPEVSSAEVPRASALERGYKRSQSASRDRAFAEFYITRFQRIQSALLDTIADLGDEPEVG